MILKRFYEKIQILYFISNNRKNKSIHFVKGNIYAFSIDFSDMNVVFGFLKESVTKNEPKSKFYDMI